MSQDNNNNNNNVSLIQLQTNAATDTHNTCHAGQYVHTVQHGNVSSHTWTTTAIQGALGLLNAADEIFEVKHIHRTLEIAVQSWKMKSFV